MTEHEIRTCVELEPPPEDSTDILKALGTAHISEAALVRLKKWVPGQTLRVHFLDGDPAVQAKVARVARQWTVYANIKFAFVQDESAEIRISFEQDGSWSYIGTDARGIWRGRPTMNYGWLTPTSSDVEYARVVLHEFGHALGLIHEHQNPDVDIPWDKEAVYSYYQGPPNNWSRSQVDTNLFRVYSASSTNFSAFDRESIMLYPVANEFTIGDFEVGWNRHLSPDDKLFMTRQYPFPGIHLRLDEEPYSAAVSEFGEIDTYYFFVEEQGTYRIETGGRTDLVLLLYGPNDSQQFIALDDDSGRRLNPKLIRDLGPGRYMARIHHFSQQRTGDYSIVVQREE